MLKIKNYGNNDIIVKYYQNEINKSSKEYNFNQIEINNFFKNLILYIEKIMNINVLFQRKN